MKTARIPAATITRLSLYARSLEKLKRDRTEVVSSDRLSELCHVKAAQIRKDLAYFGEFGVRGLGYDVAELLFQIQKILGVNRTWNLALIGMGNLGTALACHENFVRRGYICVAAFDRSPAKIGLELPCGLKIEPADQLIPVCRSREVEIAAITTPPDQAQEVANRLLEVPIRAILNFAPVQVKVPDEVIVDNVDLTVRMDRLAYHLTRR